MTKHDQIQKEIIEKTLKFFKDPKSKGKGYLNLAMRAGKTRISIETLKALWPDTHPVILIAYPDNRNKQVWEEECVKWDYNNPWITYVNFSSLKKHVEIDYDVFICDEFHSLSPNEMMLAKHITAELQLFLSGTVTQETKDKWPEFKEIASYTTLQGIEDGILADYQITVHLVPLDNKILTEGKNKAKKTEKQRYDAYSWVIRNKGAVLCIWL